MCFPTSRDHCPGLMSRVLKTSSCISSASLVTSGRRVSGSQLLCLDQKARPVSPLVVFMPHPVPLLSKSTHSRVCPARLSRSQQPGLDRQGPYWHWSMLGVGSEPLSPDGQACARCLADVGQRLGPPPGHGGRWVTSTTELASLRVLTAAPRSLSR